MNRNKIKKHLREKITEFIDSFDGITNSENKFFPFDFDESTENVEKSNSTDFSKLKELLSRDIVVSGGCIVSLLLGEKPNDYDLYLKTEETRNLVVEFYKYDKNGEVENYTKDFFPLSNTKNAVTLTNEIQLTTRFFGSIEEIHKNFDFVHCTCSYDYVKDELTIPDDAIDSLARRVLIYKQSNYPIASLVRVKKFLNRNFKIGKLEYIKIALDISELDLLNFDILQDQITGFYGDDFKELDELFAEIKEEKIITKQMLLDAILKIQE